MLGAVLEVQLHGPLRFSGAVGFPHFSAQWFKRAARAIAHSKGDLECGQI